MIENKQTEPIPIGINEYGYFNASGDVSCVLLSTLNLLKTIGVKDYSRFNKYIDNFYELLPRNSGESIAPARIPYTIEEITEGEFYGRVVAPDASNALRKMGFRHPEKYALDKENLLLPSLYSWSINEHFGHVVVILEFNRREGFSVVDDGTLMNIDYLPKLGLGYVIERNGR